MRFRLISTLPNPLLSLVNGCPLRNTSPSVKPVPSSCCPTTWPCSSSACGTPPQPPCSCHPGQCAPDTGGRDPGALSPERHLSGHHPRLPAYPREHRGGLQTAHTASHPPTRVSAQTRQPWPAPWGRGRGAGREVFRQPLTLLSLEFSHL